MSDIRVRWAAGFLVALSLVAADTAGAQVTVSLSGPAAGRMRGTMSAAIPEKFEIVERRSLSKALAAFDLGAATSAKKPPKKLLDKVAATIGKDPTVSTLLIVWADNRRIRILAVSKSGKVLLQKNFKMKGRKRKRGKPPTAAIVRALVPLWSETAKVAANEQKSGGSGGAGGTGGYDWSGGASAKEEEAFSKTRRRRRFRAVDPLANVWIDGGLYFSLGNRHLTYNALTGPLRGSEAYGMPMLGFDVSFYPGPLLDWDGLSPFGLRLAFHSAVAVQTSVRDATSGEAKIGTDYNRFALDLEARLTAGPALLTFHAGVATTTFHFDLDPNNALWAEIPDESYVMARAGMEVRFAFSDFAFTFGAAYRQPFTSGRIVSTYFPGGIVVGFDVPIEFGYRPIDWLEIRLRGNYIHYYYWLLGKRSNPQIVARSAFDIQIDGRLGVAVFF